MTTSGPVAIQTEQGIDEYLRKRLMPVEGAIPHIARTDMYRSSIPAGTVAEIFSSTSTFSSATTSTGESPVHYSCRRNICNRFHPARLDGTRWMSTCTGCCPIPAWTTPLKQSIGRREAPNNEKSLTICASITRQRAFSWWMLGDTELFQPR
jgi:hypothetical protein